MQDPKFLDRKEKFQNTRINILEGREKFKLSLRKEKLNNIFMEKRTKFLSSSNSLEINEEDLNLSIEIIEKKFSSLNELLSTLYSYLSSESEDTIKYGILQVRKLLTTRGNIPIEEIIDMGFFEKLVSILEKKESDKVYVNEILWCLLNISCVNSQYSSHLFIQDKIIHLYEKILQNTDLKILENIIWLLSNVAGDGLNCRDEILKSPILINKIYDIAKQENNPTSLIRTIAFFFSSIVKGKPEPNIEITKKSLEILTKYFSVEDYEILRDVCWGFSNISDSEDYYVQRYLIDEGIINTLISCDPQDIKDLKIPAIRILGNLLSKNDTLVDEMINLNVTQFLEKIALVSNCQVKRETCWVISNILAGPKKHVEYILNKTELLKIMERHSQDKDKDVRREAVYGIINVCVGSDIEIALDLNKREIIPTLCKILKDNDLKVLQSTLEGLKALFSHGEILKSSLDVNPFVKKFMELNGQVYLDKLQKSKNNMIYNQTLEIIERYLSFDIDNTNKTD